MSEKGYGTIEFDGLIENLIDVEVIDDFFIYHQKCRENYYILLGLEELFNSGIYFIHRNGKINAELMTQNIDLKNEEFLNKIQTLESKYSKLNKELLHPENEDIGGEQQFQKFFNGLKENLELKSSMDKLSIDCLVYFNGIQQNNIEGMINNYENLEIDFLSQINDIFFNLRLDPTVDDDRIINYRFNLSPKNRGKLIKNKINPLFLKQLPQKLKCRDYEYILGINKQRYNRLKELELKYISLISKEEENKKENKRNENQYYFNILITVSTVMPLLLIIINFFVMFKDNINENIIKFIFLVKKILELYF